MNWLYKLMGKNNWQRRGMITIHFNVKTDCIMLHYNAVLITFCGKNVLPNFFWELLGPLCDDMWKIYGTPSPPNQKSVCCLRATMSDKGSNTPRFSMFSFVMKMEQKKVNYAMCISCAITFISTHISYTKNLNCLHVYLCIFNCFSFSECYLFSFFLQEQLMIIILCGIEGNSRWWLWNTHTLHFLHMTVGVPLHPGSLHPPFYFGHHRPMCCSIQAHIIVRDWCCMSSFLLCLKLHWNRETGGTFLPCYDQSPLSAT